MKSASKSVRSNDATLAALAQILTTDEIAMLTACAAREKKSITRFTRLALRRDLYGSLDCAQADAADGLDAECVKAYATLVPLADKLNWLGLGAFPDKN